MTAGIRLRRVQTKARLPDRAGFKSAAAGVPREVVLPEKRCIYIDFGGGVEIIILNTGR